MYKEFVSKDYVTREQRLSKEDDSWSVNTITLIGLYVLLALCSYIVFGGI